MISLSMKFPSWLIYLIQVWIVGKKNGTLHFWNKGNILIIIIIYFLSVFQSTVHQWVFHWSLSDSKSSQVSRTLLCILAYLNNPVAWMVPNRLLISISSTPWTNTLLCIQPRQNSPQFGIFVITTRAGPLFKIRLYFSISKSLRTMWILFSRADSWLYICHLFVCIYICMYASMYYYYYLARHSPIVQ